jgi:polar amino acid transport system substrate-binding protein
MVPGVLAFSFPKTFFRSLGLVALLALAACHGSKSHPELRIGSELDYPPFEFANEQNQPSGLGIDLAHELATALGRPAQIQNIPFDGLIPALRTGKIDLILSSMTANDERRQVIDFSDAYFHTGISILVPLNSPAKSIADFEHGPHTLAVKKGTTGYLYARDHLPEAKLLILDKETACVLEVAERKAEGFIYDQLSILKDWQGNKATTRALLEPIRHEEWAIGLRQGDDELKKQVNAFIADFRERGGFQRLGDKWLGEQKAAFAEAGVTFVF